MRKITPWEPNWQSVLMMASENFEELGQLTCIQREERWEGKGREKLYNLQTKDLGVRLKQNPLYPLKPRLSS